MRKSVNNSGRNQLRHLIGERITFAGQVVDTKCPAPGQRFICLKRMDIGRKGKHVHCHHMWLDISHLQDVKVRLCEWIQGNAYVQQYARSNGSQSYGITNPSGLMPIAA